MGGKPESAGKTVMKSSKLASETAGNASILPSTGVTAAPVYTGGAGCSAGDVVELFPGLTIGVQVNILGGTSPVVTL